MAYRLQIPGRIFDVYTLKLPPWRKPLPVPETVQCMWLTSEQAQPSKPQNWCSSVTSLCPPSSPDPPWLNWESRRERESDRSPTLVPPHSLIWERREEVTANTASRQPNLKPSYVNSSHRRGGDRRHIAQTHIRAVTTCPVWLSSPYRDGKLHCWSFLYMHQLVLVFFIMTYNSIIYFYSNNVLGQVLKEMSHLLSSKSLETTHYWLGGKAILYYYYQCIVIHTVYIISGTETFNCMCWDGLSYWKILI